MATPYADSMDADEARARLDSLRSLLREMISRDPEQEVRGIAIPVLDAIISASRDTIPRDDAIAAVVRDIIDPVAVAAGEIDEVRAVDALLVVDQLLHSIPASAISDLPVGGASIFKPEDFGGPW